MFRTTPYLKASKPEILSFFREHIDPEERADYIRGVFNEEPTELLIGEHDTRYGYQAHPNVLHLWAGAFSARTAESFVPWRGVAREFADQIALGEFLNEPEGQLSLLPAEAPGKTIPQDAIDEILRHGSGVQDGKYRITRFFNQSQNPKERADFLKKEYGTGGMTPALGNVSEDCSAKGITLTRGRLTAPDAVVDLSWSKVQRRIGELLAADRYLDNAEQKQYQAFLQSTEKQPEIRQTTPAASFSAPPEPRPETAAAPPTQESLFPSTDSQIQQIAAEDVSSSAFSMPQADVRAVLRMGSPYEKGKFRIYEQLRHRQSRKADAAFLRNEYGTGGGSFTFSDGSEGSAAYSSKGVFICRRGADALSAPDVLLTWEQAAEQIRALIDAGQFLTPEEEKAYALWSKERTAELAKVPESSHAPLHPAPKRSDDGQISFSDLSGGGSAVTRMGTPAPASATPESPEPASAGDLSAPEGADSVVTKTGTPDAHADAEAKPEETLSNIIPTADDMEEYDALQGERPGELLAFQVGGYYLLLGAQAEIAAPLIGMKIRELDIPGRGFTKVTGFRAGEWHVPLRCLWQNGKDVVLLHQEAPGKRRFVNKELKAADFIPLGQKLVIDKRNFVVDAVNWDTGSVSLRDDTFSGATGFPIFRSESIGYIREQIEAQEQKPELAQPEQAQPEPKRPNFRITDDALGVGGKKAKYGYNITAIRLLKTLEAEGRFATPEEQETLSRYVGWGGVPQAFDEQNTQWADQYAELKGLLTDEEYAAARASTLNAHYTSPVVIKAMYEALARMGFKTGNILEPGCGVGNFFGLLPESMAASKLYGVEIDSITGRIARQLYPQADIAIDGFEHTDQPDSFFDLAVGNVPFGGFKLADRRYDKFNFQIHDYFFAKSLDKVRPGGLIAFITSKGTLDKQNPDVRKYIAQRATLLGAVRLPNTAFAANAGTEVTTDILFLQRRDRISYDEPAWVNVSKTADGVPVNQYFLDHPDMLLGTMAFDKSMYGNDKETTCNPTPGADFAQQLKTSLAQVELPNRDALEAVDVTEPDGEEQSVDGSPLSLPADPDVRNFSYTLVDDHLYFRENSKMDLVRDKSDTEVQRIRGMIALRDSTRKLIGLQMDDAADSLIAQEQQNLNGLYDAYTAKYGLLSSSANRHAFRTDSSYSLLASLEVVDEDGNLVRKADMFTKRTIRHAQPVTSVDTAAEALAVSIAEKARVDLPFMASLMGGPEKIPSVADDLRGVIFPVPDEAAIREHEKEKSAAGETRDLPAQALRWVTADEYLSGNVREKLRIAREAAASDPLFAPNVPALEQVQPKDLSAAEISVRLGATWVDTKYIDQFMFEVLQTPRHLQFGDVTTRYMDVTGVWNIKGKGLDSRDNSRVYGTYGTKRRSAYYILEDSLNLKDTRIYDTVIDENGSEKRVLNQKETAIAQQKQEALKRAFTQWIWKDPERREVLCKKYNTLYNSTRPREYDGSHLKFDGMNPEITLRKHQRNAVAHQLYGKNTLLAHWVGAGKTFEMIAAGMEAKRLGLCQKSLYVVPNHLTEQWGADFLRLYPGANVLVATKKDFEPENRRKFCARIATGDYDAVVIGHSQLEKIPVSPERQARIIEQQIDEITTEIALAKADKSERFTVKQMEKSKKALETRLQKLGDVRRDNVVTFEELGVDRLFIDEADNFKNLALFTKMRNVAGISQTEAKKSTDLYMKCRYLDEITGGRGVVFATGTPISNSMTELFTMMRYLQHDTLEEQGLSHFDSWAALYGETVSQMELKPEGTGFRMRTRFAKFHNLPELMSMWKEAADIQTADMLNLPVPKAEYINVTTEASTQQADMVQALAKRADEVHSGTVDPHIDNMLRITSDGRKLALDQRLMNELLPDDPNGKVNACVQNVLQVWRDTADQKGAQLLFCDLSTPHYDGSFNVYDDVKNKLMEAGVPAEEIAFIHDANTEARKAELFAKVRKGQVRVLLGSTSKMGAGTNVQDRLAAIHHLDCPWRPRDLTQRDGRGIRQGNLFDSIKVFRYVTKGTFDAYNWGLVESKQKFISQVVTGKSPARSCEDVDDTALSYAEVKALATGDERIKEKMELDIEVAKLRVYQTDFNSQHYELEDNVRLHFPSQIKESEAEIAGLEKDIALYREQKPQDPEAFSMTVRSAEFHERKATGEAIIEACKTVDCTEQAAEIGQYCGFPISIRWDAFSKLFHLSLKNALSHTVDVGMDAVGNVARIQNALERMPLELHAAHNHLDTLHQQMETAKEELQKAFPQEAELVEKEKRLNALNALLAAESHNPHKDTERTESTTEPALRPAEKEAKPCVHALLSELARKSEDAPRPERVASLRESVR